MNILYGKEVSDKIKQQAIEEIEKKQIKPTVAIVRIGSDPSQLSYEKNAIKKIESVNANVLSKTFDINITEEDFLNEFNKINNDEKVNGILLLRPLPKHISEEKISQIINPKKDLDGMSPINISKVMQGEDGIAPCTSEAVVEILKYYNIDLCGKNVCIINRSMVVGKPLAMLLIKENATVTICHSKTKNLKEWTKNADILVIAMGKKKYIDNTFVKDDAIIIDVGINVDEDGKICGDTNFESFEKTNVSVTPVPGGVGVVTTSMLIKHLLLNIK